MIVPTMTLPEIHAELLKDSEEIQSSLDHKIDIFGSAVLKSRRYPVERRYTITSKKRRNTFYANFSAYKRSHWKRPYFTLYCIYSRPEGLYCAYLNRTYRRTIVFPPHFFSRYRERVIQDSCLSTEDLIHLFCSRTHLISFHMMPTELQKQMRSWNGYPKDEELQFVAVCPDGVLFGQRTGDVTLAKTIVTPSMLYEDQLPLYNQLHERYTLRIREYFCKEEAEHIFSLTRT